MEDFKIRKAQSGDEALLHEAHMRSIREVCSKDHTEAEIQGWGHRPLSNRWVDAIKEGQVWVVERDHRIYGHGYIRIYSENKKLQAHIMGLYLTPEALGQGLGRELAKLMLDAAREKGVEAVTLKSTLTAHEFYKRMGFVDTGPMSTTDIGGNPVRYSPMSIRL